MIIPYSVDHDPGKQARIDFLFVIRLFKPYQYLSRFRQLLGKMRNVLLLFLRNVLRIPAMQSIIKEKDFFLTWWANCLYNLHIFWCILAHTKFTECRTLFPHQIYFSYKLSEKTKFPFNKTACKCAILMRGLFAECFSNALIYFCFMFALC